MSERTVAEFRGSAEGAALDGLELPSDGVLRRLRGHASVRRFYRLQHGGQPSVVLVVYPPDQAAAGVAAYERSRAWFAGAGVRVPAILQTGSAALVVQDCGDRLLDSVDDPAERRRLYRQAAEVMVRVQRTGMLVPLLNPDWSLDRTRLRQELEFMEEHAVRGWLGAPPDDGRRAADYDRLAELADRLPRALCHRDFHARNLLVDDDRIMVLDFQDAMLGPALYDAASLLWDNYCDVDHGTIAEALDLYWLRRGRARAAYSDAGIPSDPPGLPPAARQAFAIVGLQRSLKALGTFGFQVSVADNRGYARFAPRTWAHAVRALDGLGWAGMRDRLALFDQIVA